MTNTAPASLFGSQQDQKPDNHLEWPYILDVYLLWSYYVATIIYYRIQLKGLKEQTEFLQMQEIYEFYYV